MVKAKVNMSKKINGNKMKQNREGMKGGVQRKARHM